MCRMSEDEFDKILAENGSAVEEEQVSTAENRKWCDPTWQTIYIVASLIHTSLSIYLSTALI